MRVNEFRPVFVQNVPRELEEGVLYISETHKVVVHLCPSGCGEKVVTPLSPAEWRLTRRGDQVSLYPSIGNWNYECRSHYWIRKNKVLWAKQLSPSEIEAIQLRDRSDKEDYLSYLNRRKVTENPEWERQLRQSVWSRIRRWFRWS